MTIIIRVSCPVCDTPFVLDHHLIPLHVDARAGNRLSVVADLPSCSGSGLDLSTLVNPS